MGSIHQMRRITTNFIFPLFAVYCTVLFGCTNINKIGYIDFESIVKECVTRMNAQSVPFSYGHFLKAEYKDADKVVVLEFCVDEAYIGIVRLEAKCDSRLSALNIMAPIVNGLSDDYTLDEITNLVEVSGVSFRYVYRSKSGRILRTVEVTNKQLTEAIPYVFAEIVECYFSNEFLINYFVEDMSLFVPLRLDEYTMLEAVIATDDGPQYIYEVPGLERDDISPELIEEIRGSIISDCRQNAQYLPLFREMAKTDLVIKHAYKSQNEELFNINIKPSEILSDE